MSEIERGSQVRITLTGRYHHGRHNGHWVHIGAAPTFIPATAEIEVIAPPLPPEPPVGSYVELRTTSLDPDVYVRRDAGWLPAWSGLTAITPSTWADLHAWGRVTVLAPAGETPRYDLARAGGGALWRHACGLVSAIADHRTPDGECCVSHCLDPDGPWTRLYVSSSPASSVPDTRYEPATRGGMALWQHACGSVTACTGSEDPGADGIDCEDGCQTPTARWTRLYRGVRTDG